MAVDQVLILAARVVRAEDRFNRARTAHENAGNEMDAAARCLNAAWKALRDNQESIINIVRADLSSKVETERG